LAAAATVLPSLEVSPQAQDAVKKAPANGGGYTLSEHVKRYFKTTLV